MELAGDKNSVHHMAVLLNRKINSKLADSLILSTANFALALSAIGLAYTPYSSWTLIACWRLLPPLLLIFFVFCRRDWLRAKRKEAVEALIISIPVVLLEAWFFVHLKL